MSLTPYVLVTYHYGSVFIIIHYISLGDQISPCDRVGNMVSLHTIKQAWVGKTKNGSDELHVSLGSSPIGF